MIKNYIRKNSRVEAVLWDGENFEELQAFTTKKVQPVPGSPESLILMDEDNLYRNYVYE